MAIENLNPIHAFKPGSQVWILPEKSVSHWTRRLDWHMHFLISRLEKKEQKKIDSQVQQTLSFEEIDFDFNPQQNYDAILLATHGIFPNACSVLIKNYKSPESWLAKIIQVQESLKPKSLRIFLPSQCNAQQFLKIAKKDLDNVSVTLVEDSL